jgi:hypothetical protein
VLSLLLALLQLRESLVARTKSKPGGNVTEALHCVGVLAGALHLSWQPYAQQLLDCMMLTGPTQVSSYLIYFFVSRSLAIIPIDYVLNIRV